MFRDIFTTYDPGEVRDRIYGAGEAEVIRAISAESPDPAAICALFSPAADPLLEMMARRSAAITRQRFGSVVQLYAPLYISNECTNRCVYCGFNTDNPIRRATLSEDQVVREAMILHEAGFRHILLLTGEDRRAVPVDEVAGIARRLRDTFASLSVEVYPMETEEYGTLAAAGIDGLTLYQETYDTDTYRRVHLGGKKTDFFWRLDGPDRGGIAGFRRIGIGALLGLSDWRVDGFYTALHGLYLAGAYWRSQVQVSFPRLRDAPGGFTAPVPVSDRDLVHLICAVRIILPDAHLSLSTREPEGLRDDILPLGITSMSAGSKTDPGGYSGLEAGDGQFEICDRRSPAEVAAMIRRRGFDPVWKDWDRMLR